MSKQPLRSLPAATVTAAIALLLGLVVTAFAAVPTFWRLENQSDFLSGDTDGVSIDSDGRVTLAPAANAIIESTEPNIWSLAMARSGNLYAGTGNDGRVLEIDPSGNETVIADFDELQVHALAVNRSGTVFAGTSPRGAVYEVRPGGAYEVFFDPDERYIWALAFDSAGNLLVATGDPARIHRVSPSGESEELFTSEETHIVSLSIDRNDRILAGTDPNGLVLSVAPNGTTSVVFDTSYREVRALVSDSRGNIYAATVNGSGRASSPEPESTTTSSTPPAAGPTATVTVTTSLAPQVTSSSASSSSSSGGAQAGGLYRIDSEGAADLIWQSRDTPLSLSMATDDRLMVGTGNEGRVYLVSQDKTSSLLLSVDADQVTAILPGSEGQSFLATSNPAKLYRLNRGRRTEGVYISPAKDTGTVSSWGKIRWEARVPSGAGLTLETRSGNSAEPDNTWSQWSAALTQSAGEQVTSPRGRFFQWRAVLSSAGETTPELHNVTAVYLQQNIAPQVSEIKIHAPGQVYQKPLVSSGEIDVLGMADSVTDPNAPSNGANAGAAGPGAASMNMMALARPIYRKGIQTVTWTASDANNDELRFDVEYRAEGESFWRPLRTGLTDSVVAWDTVAMPDGRYTLRVVASDAPDNPGDMARTGERTSRSFEVDNSPPSVTGFTAEREGNGHRVRFVAEDAVSPIQSVEYSINSGAWNIVFPNDGIADSTQESFDFLLTGYQNGVFTLVVKVTDTLSNTATARIELR